MRALNRVGRGGAWSPLAPGLPLAWFDASSGVVHSGSAFTSWTDRARGVVLTVAGGSATYSATGWNGAKPGVTLAVSALDSSSTPLATHGSSYTVLATVDTTGSGTRFCAGWYNSGSGSTFGAGVQPSGTLDRFDPTTVSTPSYTGTSVQGRKRWALTDTSTSLASGVISTWINGGQSANAFSINARTSVDRFRMGCNSIGGVLFTGTVAEIIFYAGILSVNDIAAYSASYSPNKWGG